jgi:hypothetical protein
MNRKCFLFLLCLNTFACVEQIDFPVERTGGQLVVDGGITDSEEAQFVKLSFTAESDRVPVPVEDAQVKIFDDLGQSEDYFHDGETPGTYALYGNVVQGRIGRTYYLQVILSDGRVYRSAPEKMPSHPVSMESIDYDFSIQEKVSETSIISQDLHIDVFMDVDLSEAIDQDQEVFLRWDVEEVFLLTPTDFPDPFGNVPPPCYVYVYTSATDLRLFDGSENRSTRLNDLQVASRAIDFSFREKHYFSVYQKSLTQEAFQYWRKVDALLSNNGNIFDTPPAPLPGNMYNVNDPEEEVLGYFEAASQRVIRFKTYREDIPLDQILECQYSPAKFYSQYPDYCLDCLTIRNSTYRRPDFF